VGPFHTEPPYEDEAWAPDRSLNGALSEHESAACYVDIAGVADDPELSAWLGEHHPVRDIGTAFWDESAHLTGYRVRRRDRTAQHWARGVRRPVERESLAFV
jgi:hypothetical protein